MDNIFNEKNEGKLNLKLAKISDELKEHGFALDLESFMVKMRQYEKEGKIVIPKDSKKAIEMS